MKKFVALVLVALLALSAACLAFAEETTGVESQFEKVLLQKGSLLIKEFISVATVGDYRPTAFQAATLTDAETGAKFYALRLDTSYYNSQYDTGSVSGVLDSAEIDGAITTLQYVKDHLAETRDYTEIIYTASSGLVIGGYHSSSGDSLFIKFNSGVTKYYEVSEADDLINALQMVKAAFGN